jgi:colanic acid biosynthesis glycosyl transferase WcaI
MYSGNHSPCHPLETLISAAERLADRPDIVFCFVGGGSEFRRVRQLSSRLANVLCLEYQPFDRLAASLSAADLQVVVMGNPFVGILHPCKVYNAMAVGAPVLYVGPTQSHFADISSGCASRAKIFSAEHGEVDRVVAHILSAARLRERSTLGMPDEYSRYQLVRRFLSVVSSALHSR